MKHLTLPRFWRHYRRLPKEVQELLEEGAAAFAMQGDAASLVKLAVLNEPGDEGLPVLCTQIMMGPCWSNTASRWSADPMIASC